MGEVIVGYLPMAIGLAIVPIPIIAVILMLFSGRARANGTAFLVAWLAAVMLAMGALVAIASTQDQGTADDPSTTSARISVVLGLALIALGVRQWRKRPMPGTDPEMPAWMARVDSMHPPAAAGLAVVLAVLNPKNLLLIAGAAAVVAQAGLSTGDDVVAIVVFALIGSIGVEVPVLGYLFLGERMQPRLDAAKFWLTRNSATVMAGLLLVIGLVLLAKGVPALG
jgi:hypothetical protein